MQTSNDADEYEKPNLDCMIGASLADDLGVNSAVLGRILWLFGSRYHRWVNDGPLGFNEDIGAVEMAYQETKPKTRMPAM